MTPERIAFDPSGALLVSDFSLGPDEDGGIVRVDPEDGSQTLVRAGELFNHPLGIATVVNRPPTAALTADPPVVAAGSPVRLDASRSGDPDGLQLAYEWDLDGDGGFEAGSGGIASASRSFAINGPATVRVRVNDPHGGQAVAETTVLVDGAVPVITELRGGARVLGVGRRRQAGRANAATAATPAAAARHHDRLQPVRARHGEPRGGARTSRSSHGGRRPVPRPRTPWPPLPPLVSEAAGPPGRRGRANAYLLRARGLRPGRYRLLLSAVDAVGNRSAQRRRPFRVVRLGGEALGSAEAHWTRSARRASGTPSPRPRSTSPRPSSPPPGPACRPPCRPLTPSSRGTGCRPC